MDVQEQSCNEFLKSVWNAIEKGKIIPINRDKNINSLAKLGITWSDALSYLKKLRYTDYCKGPSVDRDQPDSDYMWVFKTYIESEIVYIKMKVLYQKNNELKIINFHIDDDFDKEE